MVIVLLFSASATGSPTLRNPQRQGSGVDISAGATTIQCPHRHWADGSWGYDMAMTMKK